MRIGFNTTLSGWKSWRFESLLLTRGEAKVGTRKSGGLQARKRESGVVGANLRVRPVGRHIGLPLRRNAALGGVGSAKHQSG
ncbi:MAG: hypothetical protein FWH15_01815 [Betaproteobacteria bacterium]|nr:hypothetical protein [Betaproteobacteria bacterium]